MRLAAKLTGWKIDVRSQTAPDEVQEGGIAGTLDAEDSGQIPPVEDEREDIIA